ncbi:hypothetical protein Tco_0478295 [Tanacetum coccineum]
MVGEEGGGVAANPGEARRSATSAVAKAPRHYTLCSNYSMSQRFMRPHIHLSNSSRDPVVSNSKACGGTNPILTARVRHVLHIAPEGGFYNSLIQFFLDYDSQMTSKYFTEYTRNELKQFRDTLLQYMGNVKKFVAKRTCHQRQYDKRVNNRQMQTQESKVDTGKAVDVDLVITESSGTESEVQDDSSRSWNDTNADDADIRPIYDEEPTAAECNIFAI